MTTLEPSPPQQSGTASMVFSANNFLAVLSIGSIVRVTMVNNNKSKQGNKEIESPSTLEASTPPVYMLKEKLELGDEELWRGNEVIWKGGAWVEVFGSQAMSIKVQKEDDRQLTYQEYTKPLETYRKVQETSQSACCIQPTQMGRLEVCKGNVWISVNHVAMISPYHTPLMDYLSATVKDPHKTALILVKVALVLEKIQAQGVVLKELRICDVVVEELISRNPGIVLDRPLFRYLGGDTMRKPGPVWPLSSTTGYYSLPTLSLKFWSHYGLNSDDYDEAWSKEASPDQIGENSILEHFKDSVKTFHRTNHTNRYDDRFNLGIIFLQALSNCKVELYGGQPVSIPVNYAERIDRYFNQENMGTFQELEIIVKEMLADQHKLWDPMQRVYFKELGQDFNYCFSILMYLIQVAPQNPSMGVNRGNILEDLLEDLEERITKQPTFIPRKRTVGELTPTPKPEDKAIRSWDKGAEPHTEVTSEGNCVVTQSGGGKTFEVFVNLEIIVEKKVEKEYAVCRKWKHGRVCGTVEYVCGLCFDASKDTNYSNGRLIALISHWSTACPATLNSGSRVRIAPIFKELPEKKKKKLDTSKVVGKGVEKDEAKVEEAEVGVNASGAKKEDVEVNEKVKTT